MGFGGTTEVVISADAYPFAPLKPKGRMRNATIVVVRLKGTATEAIKNMVLAGIGKLVMVDNEEVTEEDLGAGFLFRDEDVGKNRVEAAKSKVESLNPLVTVETMSNASVLVGEQFEDLVRRVDLVCITDWDRDGLIRMNEVCRRNGKPFYSGGTYGLLGYIFCDLLNHEYIAPDRSTLKEVPKSVKKTEIYSQLEIALRHQWTSLTKRQTKEVNPAAFFSILTAHEFSPVCAIVGGMLGQDILKALAAREPPIANFFVFDGNTGAGTVTRLTTLSLRNLMSFVKSAGAADAKGVCN
ncbi:hypothetical protein C0993_000413 [Termitomyces sp. T159_Od127]|nr:hypothetical protein C0993_000413 [Termitomyces sp. T159_Od127]